MPHSVRKTLFPRDFLRERLRAFLDTERNATRDDTLQTLKVQQRGHTDAPAGLGVTAKSLPSRGLVRRAAKCRLTCGCRVKVSLAISSKKSLRSFMSSRSCSRLSSIALSCAFFRIFAHQQNRVIMVRLANCDSASARHDSAHLPPREELSVVGLGMWNLAGFLTALLVAMPVPDRVPGLPALRVHERSGTQSERDAFFSSFFLLSLAFFFLFTGRSSVAHQPLPQPSHKSLLIKKKLGKKMKQNRPLPNFIRLRTDNKIRYNSKRRHWRRTSKFFLIAVHSLISSQLIL